MGPFPATFRLCQHRLIESAQYHRPVLLACEGRFRQKPFTTDRVTRKAHAVCNSQARVVLVGSLLDRFYGRVVKSVMAATEPFVSNCLLKERSTLALAQFTFGTLTVGDELYPAI
jgi:hypothetical protein